MLDWLMLIMTILCFLIAVIQTKVAIAALTSVRSIEKELSPLSKIKDHMDLAEGAKDTLKLLKKKYPNIDFGIEFK